MPKHQSHTSSHLPSALVAGAGGFLGSHLCETLLSQNCQVYAVDNWSTGKKSNLEHLFKSPNFVFIEQDLDKPFETTLPHIDYVFHLAGLEAYLFGKDVSLETLLVNSLGTRELLEIAKKNKAKFLMASTIDIFSGQLSSSDLTHYFGAAHHQEELYSYQEAKRFSEAITFEYVNRYDLNARIVRLGFVYGPRMGLGLGNQLGDLFSALKNKQPIKIFGQGLTALYPTYIADVVYGLTKSMFSQSSGGKIFTLINPEKITVLNLAYKLQQLSLEKNLKVEFAPKEVEESNFILPSQVFESQQDLGWQPKVNLDQGIMLTLKWLKDGQSFEPAPEKKETPPEPLYTPEDLGISPAPVPIQAKKIAKPRFSFPKFNFKIKFKIKLPNQKIKLSLKPHPIRLSRRFKFIFLSISLLFIYLFVPVILLFFSGLRASAALKQAVGLQSSKRADQLAKLSLKAKQNFDFGRRLLNNSQAVLFIVGGKNLSSGLDRFLFIGSKLSVGALHLAKAGEAGTILSKIIFQHQEGNLSQALKDVQLNLDQAYIELSFVESELQSGRESGSDLLIPLNQKLQNLTSGLPDIRRQINQVRQILPLVPSFIAQDSKKTYLVLMQNSAEIRPTGGFIGSYGLLIFEKGKLLDFSVEDIYAADGQLKGYVQPPKPIEKFLGQNTWYFRDSNWDPDFLVSAQRAEWFLNKTTNRNVDGVIAVNLPAVKELLKATGPISLADYNEELTTDNVFERAEYHSEIDFFPGSTQKKDFLGALARELFNRLKNSSSAEMINYAQALEASLGQKQILVYLHEPESQRLLMEQNWAGAIFSPKLSLSDNRPVTEDYAYFVEANLGINKANYFLKRNIEQQLTILKNKEILAVSNISYQNQSPADAWPGGIYRSYLREYLPENASLISVKVGESKLNLKDVDQEIVNNKLVIGFPVTVPVKSSLKVEVTYRLLEPLKFINRQSRLAVVVPKQPGIIDDQLSVIVNYPSFLSVSGANPGGIVSPQVVSFKSDMSLDRAFTVDFTER